jgi:hypothetical protein
MVKQPGITFLYLAGPMRGLPQYNFPAFAAAAASLRDADYLVLSPAEQDMEAGFNPATDTVTDEQAERMLERDFALIRQCDAMAILPGYESSAGVAREIDYALGLGRKFTFICAATGRMLASIPADPADMPTFSSFSFYSYVTSLAARLGRRPGEGPPAAAVAAPQPVAGCVRKFETGSVRDNRDGKWRYDLLPMHAIYRLVRRFEDGAKKYGENNWRKGQPLSSYLDSAMRHLARLAEGHRDEDHAAAVLWNVAAMIETEAAIERGRLPASLADLPDYT